MTDTFEHTDRAYTFDGILQPNLKSEKAQFQRLLSNHNTYNLNHILRYEQI